MMQESMLFEQPGVGPGSLLATRTHDLTAGNLDSLLPQQLSGGTAPHNVPAWESYPNMFQPNSDATRWPRRTPASAARLNTSVNPSVPSSPKKAVTSRRVSTTGTTDAALAQVTEKPDTTSTSNNASGSLGSAAAAAAPSGNPGRKRKAAPRKRTVIKQEEPEAAPVPAPSKRNKFLERNRLAASKCREKKKVWLHDLEETKHELELRHRGLRMEYESLMEEVTRIKNSLVNHACCSDPNIDTWIRNEAHNFVKRSAERPPTPSYSGSSMSPSARMSMSRDSITSEQDRSGRWRSINYDHMPDDLSEN